MIIIGPQLKHKVKSHSEDFVKVTVAFDVIDDSVTERLKEINGRVYNSGNSVTENLKAIFTVAEQKGAFGDERVMHNLYTLMFSVAEAVGCNRSCKKR